MKFSWNWLKRFIDLSDVDPMTVANRYTMSVAELEGVEHIGTGLDGVIAMRVDAVLPVEGSDKLHKIKVWTGKEHVIGVSGAPNLRVGMIAAGALPGTSLPMGEVKRTRIRGIESAVLLLSEKEMGLTDDHSGVMEVFGIQPGTKLAKALAFEDFIFEIDNKSITHRPDLWGHEGVAREVALLAGKTFKLPAYDLPEQGKDALTVKVMDPAACPRYMAAGFTNVQVGPSPFWLKYALYKVGLRPISNVVDITNFVMLDTGNPMHAFDRRFLRGDTIVVRRAKQGEAFTSLDDVPHVLTTEDLVIADQQGPVALAGVIGGQNSEIRQDTTDVVLEAANFHPAMIRRTAIRHGVRTDSSARFEKSLDPNQAWRAAALFSKLLLELSPTAQRSTRLYDIRAFETKTTSISVSMDYVNQRLGTVVPTKEAVRILEGLGFGVQVKDQVLNVDAPSYRTTKDIAIPEDLVEEIGRLWGYDRIRPVSPPIRARVVPRLKTKGFQQVFSRILRLNRGFSEVKTYSFYDNDFNSTIEYEPQNALKLKNPASQVMDTLRTSMVPNLLQAVYKNATYRDSFGLFEFGRVFFDQHLDDGTPVQYRHLGVVFYDKAAKGHEQKENALLSMKGLVADLLNSENLADVDLETRDSPIPPLLHPNGRAKISVQNTDIGYYGLVHPFVTAKLGLKGTIVVAEINLDALAGLESEPKLFKKISKFPSVTLDLSVIVDEGVGVGGIRDAILRAAGKLVRDIQLVVVYRGKPIEQGKKSVTWRFTLQAEDHTLTDAETSGILDAAIAGVEAIGGEVKRG